MKFPLISYALLSIAICFSTLETTAQATGAFRAAVVKKDITPDTDQYLLGYNERKSNGVHDHIFHRIVLLDDGNTQFCLVSSDLCVISPGEYDRMAARLQKELGISPLNFWWSLTHTHSAPEVGPMDITGCFMSERYAHELDKDYTKLAEDRLLDGIKEARRQLTPAQMGSGWGFSRANINRRAQNEDGIATLGMDPDGPVDRRIGMLKIDKTDGSPLVLIANYAMHGTVLGSANLKISGDGPGVVSEYVERKTGAPMLFVNGAAGNVAPLYSTGPMHFLSQFNVLLGDKIIDAAARIKTAPEVKLRTGERIVETPRNTSLKWPVTLAKYAGNNKGVPTVKLPVRFLKINEDIAIWSAPLELFCEISMEVREKSSFPFTFYFGYTNGWFGYLPTEKEWERKGYEPMVSSFTPAAEKDLLHHVMEYLEGPLQNTQYNPAKKMKKKTD
jgi:hypothetical protein